MLKADVPARPNGTKELVTEFAVEDMKNTQGLVSIGKENLGVRVRGGVGCGGMGLPLDYVHLILKEMFQLVFVG